MKCESLTGGMVMVKHSLQHIYVFCTFLCLQSLRMSCERRPNRHEPRKKMADVSQIKEAPRLIFNSDKRMATGLRSLLDRVQAGEEVTDINILQGR